MAYSKQNLILISKAPTELLGRDLWSLFISACISRSVAGDGTLNKKVREAQAA